MGSGTSRLALVSCLRQIPWRAHAIIEDLIGVAAGSWGTDCVFDALGAAPLPPAECRVNVRVNSMLAGERRIAFCVAVGQFLGNRLIILPP